MLTYDKTTYVISIWVVFAYNKQRNDKGDKKMDLEIVTQFQNKLLEWYDNSARVLPWRDNPSPYRVWISEIMLQQTRVHTVKPYFENFMKEVPTIEALANISEDKLLKLWEGMGYYSRARNLKKAAALILQEFDGIMPSTIEGLKSLPGIGPYTSGAIASIAFGVRVSAIDGNVLRGIARITANQGDITNGLVKKEIEGWVNAILPKARVGDFNQGLMELGATICLPNGMPKCTECPVAFLCQGYHKGIALSIPFKAKKKPRKIEEKTIFVIEYKDSFALRQRPNVGLLSNLWEFPHIEGSLSYEECDEEMQKWNMKAERIIPLNKCKHIFTHLEWYMMGYYVLIHSLPKDSGFIWATKKEIQQRYSIPSAFKEYLNYLLGGEDTVI